MKLTALDIASGTRDQAGAVGYEHRLVLALDPEGADASAVDAMCLDLAARLALALAEWRLAHGIAPLVPPVIPQVVLG